MSFLLDLTLRYTSVIQGPHIEEKITVEATYLENAPKSSGTKSNAKIILAIIALPFEKTVPNKSKQIFLISPSIEFKNFI